MSDVYTLHYMIFDMCDPCHYLAVWNAATRCVCVCARARATMSERNPVQGGEPKGGREGGKGGGRRGMTGKLEKLAPFLLAENLKSQCPTMCVLVCLQQTEIQ